MNLPVNFFTLFKKTWQEFGNDNVARLSAAFAYYTFTAFFPLLLVLVALVGVGSSLGIERVEDARKAVTDTVRANVPAAGPLLDQSFQETERNSVRIGIFGVLIGLWTASNIFAQLEESLNMIFDVAPRRRTWMQRAMARAEAAGMVLLLGVLMVGSLIFSTLIATVQGFVQSLPWGEAGSWLLNLLLSLLLLASICAALFRFLPDKPVTWRAALVGGIFTSVAWQIGREALTLYLGSRQTPEAGELIGAVLGFLILIYYGSLILMFGAQVAATYDELVNPDLVRSRTADDSALSGHGGGIVTESGDTLTRVTRDE